MRDDHPDPQGCPRIDDRGAPHWLTDAYLTDAANAHGAAGDRPHLAAEILRLRRAMGSLDPTWQAADFVREAAQMLAAVNAGGTTWPVSFDDKFGLLAQIRTTAALLEGLRRQLERQRAAGVAELEELRRQLTAAIEANRSALPKPVEKDQQAKAHMRTTDARDALDVGLQFAADARKALAGEPDRVVFTCSRCTPKQARAIEDQINCVVARRVEAERAKHQPQKQTGVLPMRLDDDRLLAVDSIAGQAHPDAQPDGFPAELTLTMGWIRCRYVRMDTAQRKAAENQQRFSISTDFYNALWRAKSADKDHDAVVAVINALAHMARAVEAEFSARGIA